MIIFRPSWLDMPVVWFWWWVDRDETFGKVQPWLRGRGANPMEMFIYVSPLQRRQREICLWNYGALRRIKTMMFKMLSSKPNVALVGLWERYILEDLFV